MKSLTLLALCSAWALTGCKASFDFDLGFEPKPKMGVELQGYPAGVIPAIRWEWEGKRNDVWSARLGFNKTNRRGWGEHDDETGDGFGLGVGWRYWQLEDRSGWHYGGRLDFWDLNIDWRDDNPTLREGRSSVIVTQPTLEGGYSWLTKKGGRVDLTLGLGAEINVDTDEEDVGEGAIVLIGIGFMP